MFTSATHKEVKEETMKYFCLEGTRLRVVICTVAFSMGINYRDVRQVIHLGASADIESYVHVTGQVGEMESYHVLCCSTARGICGKIQN